MKESITRRAMLAAIPSAWAARSSPEQKSQPLPRMSEFVRFTDPVTETPVIRLTDPRTASLLPLAQNRFVSSKRRFLFFSSDRTGKPCPFQLDLRSGALRQLAETTRLDPRSLALDRRERSLYFIDEGVLKEAGLANRKIRTVVEGVSAFSEGASPSDLWVITEGQVKNVNSGEILAHETAELVFVQPGGRGCLFLQELGAGKRAIWYAGINDRSQPKLLADGAVWDPFWSRNGDTVLFLRSVERENAYVAEIHEIAPDSGAERVIAPTSQYAAFAPNEDGSVFAGASGSKAQPNVVLLLRSVRRELTLCEHGARDPAAVSPIFSPDSKRIYFASDREGKPAIYSVNVELLVEPTPVIES